MSPFFKSEQFGGALLFACTIVSLALANSPVAAQYIGIWHVALGPLSLEHWINDALMAVFFLLIGLELERELYVGELSTLRNALLPAFAAAGGMLVPALIHYGFNAGTVTQPGFGIPMATDIAFALAVLALLGTRVPPALKVFVVAFAVIDDLGAIVLIAAVYTADIHLGYLIAALAVWAGLIVLNRRFRVMQLTPYLLGGVALWICLLNAGIHASIAGVMLAFAVPFSTQTQGLPSPSQKLEHWLKKPVAWLVLPLFALANTALPLDGESATQFGSANSLGIALGLIVGKPIGVIAMCLLAVACGASALPAGVRWMHVAGAGLLGGIGFTMSIFITNLAFGGDIALVNASKLTVLAASLAAGVAGMIWLRLVPGSESRKSRS